MTDAESEYNRDAYGTPLGKPYRGLGVLTVKENPDEYNGWTNRETWAVNLWLSNDQGIYNQIRDIVATEMHEARERAYEMNWPQPVGRGIMAAALGVQSWVLYALSYGSEVLTPEDQFNMRSDVGSLWRVDWEEVARAFAEE